MLAFEFNHDFSHFNFFQADGTLLIRTEILAVFQFFDLFLGQSLGDFAYFLSQIDELLSAISITS